MYHTSIKCLDAGAAGFHKAYLEAMVNMFGRCTEETITKLDRLTEAAGGDKEVRRGGGGATEAWLLVKQLCRCLWGRQRGTESCISAICCQSRGRCLTCPLCVGVLPAPAEGCD